MASHPCLPVSRRRKNRDNAAPVDFNDIASMDATEFLSRVVQQSSQLPEILSQKPNTKEYKSNYADHVPIEGSAASINYILSNRTDLVPPPAAQHSPKNTTAWLDQTLSNFSQLRTYLEKLQKQQGKLDRKQPVPPMKDRPGWHIFCVGTTEARGNVGAYFDPDEDDDGDDDEEDGKNEKEKEGMETDRIPADNNDSKDENNMAQSTNEDGPSAYTWRRGLPEEGFSPRVSLILQMDQVMIRRVISHLSHYVQEGWYPCSQQRTQWLYSLLARLEKPIHRNDAAVLYSLLKALTRARATLTDLVDKDREGLARLNTLIAIVGVYFEQGGGLCF